MKRLLKMQLQLLGMIWLLLQPYHVMAQERLSGTVIDSKDKKPLPGATVTVQGGSGKAITNADGKFEIFTRKGNSLVISMIGYTSQTVNAGVRIQIELVPSAVNLEDVVVLGYGTQKKELLTGSVVTMKMDDTRRNTPTTSLGNLLAGQMAGVKVGTPDGVPGSQPGINIRVGTTFKRDPNDKSKIIYSSQDALYVIDGKISGAVDFNNLSPNDIDNISILKDASTAAVYGSRAAGGVVLVTTRTGKKNTKGQINYSFNTGFDERGKNAALTSAIQTGQIYNRINPSSSSIWTQSDFDYFKNINNGWGYDQLSAVYQTPYITSHNLSASGGGDNITYFIGGSYTKQGTFMKNSTYDKYNIRANISADITKNLNLFTGLTINNNLSYMPPNTAVGDIRGIYRKQLLWQPEQPVWTNGGNPIDYGWIGNVGAEVRGDGGYVKSNGIKPILNMKATYKIPVIEGLSVSAQFNKSYTNNRTKYFEKQYNMYVMKITGTRQISTDDADKLALKQSSQVGKSYIQEDYSWNNDYQLDFQLNYEHSFKKHNIKGWLTYEKAVVNSGGISAGRETFPVYLTDQWWAASGARADGFTKGGTDQIEQSTGRKSYVGQIFYDYDGKYLASFASRYDGSMNFAPNQRWGLFPSGSIGWILSKEKFMENLKDIDFLKIRASVGLTGNDAVGGWQWLQSYQSGKSAYFGTTPSTNVGITYGALVNPNLTWEKTLNYNAGVDINFLKHFNATAEYYFVKTYDILGPRVNSVPPTFSLTIPDANYGQVNANGVEINVGYKNRMGNVNYYANVNASYGAAKYIIQDQNVTYPWQANAGQSVSRITAYQSTGMLRTQADLDAFVAAHPAYKFNGISPAIGQLTYADLSGPNGKPDGIVDSWDQTQVKNSNNPIVLGLNFGFEWKGFSIDATFSGNLHQMRFVNNLVDGNVEWNRMWANWATDAWTPATPNATLPIRYSANDGTKDVTNTASTFWLKDASFLRMKLLNVGYNIPAKYLQKIGVGGVKFYFSGSNLFIISKFNKNYFDPEIGDPFGYPIMKTFNFGVNVSL